MSEGLNESTVKEEYNEQPMRLRDALVRYLACWFGFSLTGVTGLVIVMLVAYIAAGVYLNRVVLRGLIEWHPMYNTIDNVASGKIGMFLFWPLSYPFLFAKLGINKVL